MSWIPGSRGRATAGAAGPRRSYRRSAATSAGRRTAHADSGSGVTTTTSQPCPVVCSRCGRARRTWCRLPTRGRPARPTTRICSTSTSRAPMCPTTSTHRRTPHRPSTTRVCRKEVSTRTSTAQASEVAVAGRWHDRMPAGLVVPSCDAFYLHAEATGSAQHLGGLVVFEPVSDDEALSVERVRDVVRYELQRLPRFHQRLAPLRRWRRPRWVDAPDIDWAEHISERRCPDGPDGLRRTVAELAETLMRRDRPLWRIVMVRDVEPGQHAMILLLHHAVADGIGTVVQALNLLRPRIEPPGTPGRALGRIRLAAATVVGLAQLATDGGVGVRPAASSRGEFATADLDLAAVRSVASAKGVRVTDLVLALVAEAVAETHPELSSHGRGRLRVAVPLTVRGPGTAAETNA